MQARIYKLEHQQSELLPEAQIGEIWFSLNELMAHPRDGLQWQLLASSGEATDMTIQLFKTRLQEPAVPIYDLLKEVDGPRLAFDIVGTKLPTAETSPV
jgi:hypothetical protein